MGRHLRGVPPPVRQLFPERGASQSTTGCAPAGLGEDPQRRAISHAIKAPAHVDQLRTQELLAARRIDGGEQFFTRAIDFGFSKSADEAIRKWGRAQLASDIDWIIRTYRPDTVVLGSTGTPAGEAKGTLRVAALVNGHEISAGMSTIACTHVPQQLEFPRRTPAWCGRTFV